MNTVVCGDSGTIYYTKILSNGKMSKCIRDEVTADAIKAVADHIMTMPEYEKNKGFTGYEFTKVGGGKVCLCVYDKDNFCLMDVERLEQLLGDPRMKPKPEKGSKK